MSDEQYSRPLTPPLSFHYFYLPLFAIPDGVSFDEEEEKANQYFKIYTDMQTMDPLFSLNDLIALRDILTEVIDNEKKAKEIKTIINLRNKK